MWYFFDALPPEPPSAARVSRALVTAIDKGRADDARALLDQAFWDKLDFKPDAFHLLLAAQRGDRALVTLLTGYGARWTPEEAKVACSMVKPGLWAQIKGPLKNAGIPADFTAEDLARRDFVTAAGFAHRGVQEARARGRGDTGADERELEAAVSKGFVTLVLANRLAEAKNLLPYRDAKQGRGTAADPLDVSREVDFIFRQHPFSVREGMLFLDRLKAAGLAVKPLEVTTSMMFLRPEVVLALDERGLLAAEQPAARREVLGSLTATQEVIRLGDTEFNLGADTVARRRAELTAIARVLFPKEKPVTVREADHFLWLHEMRRKDVPEGLRAAEAALLALGFFDGPAWDSARLRRLAPVLPPDETAKRDRLAEAFNARALRRTVEELGVQRILKRDEGLAELIEAHRLGAYKADAASTALIVKALARQLDRSAPAVITAALQTLKDAGADFRAVDPIAYLGRKSPGLAKQLLDLDIVEAAHFDLRAVSRKLGGKLDLITLPHAKKDAYTGFVCQLVLELTEPEKARKLRGASSQAYQQQFLQAWLRDNGGQRLSTFSYRRRMPGL